MRNLRIDAAISLVLVLGLTSACSTSLRVLALKGNDRRLPEGVVYYLSKAEFDITLTRELRRCDPVKRTVIFEKSLRELGDVVAFVNQL